MRRVAFCALAFLTATAVSAASPEDDYAAARSRYQDEISKLSAQNSPALAQREAARLADLERRLRALLGAPRLPGFSPGGRPALTSLDRTSEFSGVLDGLVFVTPSAKFQALITTPAFVKAFVGSLKVEDDEGAWVTVATLAEAMGRSEFFSVAFGEDSVSDSLRWRHFADFVLPPPAGAVGVQAAIVAHADEAAPDSPNELVVALDLGNRVEFGMKRLETSVMPPPGCSGAREEAGRAAASAEATWRKASQSGAANTEISALRVEVDASRDRVPRAYLRCFAREAPKSAFFRDVEREAASLALRLAPSR